MCLVGRRAYGVDSVLVYIFCCMSSFFALAAGSWASSSVPRRRVFGCVHGFEPFVVLSLELLDDLVTRGTAGFNGFYYFILPLCLLGRLGAEFLPNLLLPIHVITKTRTSTQASGAKEKDEILRLPVTLAIRRADCTGGSFASET